MARQAEAAVVDTRPPPAVAYLSTLEVRWILPGRTPVSTARWFARFPAGTEAREDRYLVHPQQGGISVKVRGSALLELKLQHDDGRVLDLPGPAAAGVKACEKWSFLLAGPDDRVPAGGSWTRVGKTRRLCRFTATGEPLGPATLDGKRAACEAELTDIRVDDQDWWTLALEAVGPGDGAWDALRAGGSSIFARPLPASLHLGPGNATTYSEWLQALAAFR